MAQGICEVEEEGVVSERVAKLWFKLFNTAEGNTKDLPSSGRPKLRDIEKIGQWKLRVNTVISKSPLGLRGKVVFWRWGFPCR